MLALVAGVFLVLGGADAASAHDYPVRWSPAAGSTVTTPPTTVSITFDDLVLDLSGDSHTSLLQVTHTSQGATRYFATGCTVTKGREVSVPVVLGPAGDYKVSYQIVSADGHVVSGNSTFHYRPASGTTQAAGTSSPACEAAGPARAASPSATAGRSGGGVSGTSGSAGLPFGIVLGVAGTIVALAVIAVVVVLFTTRRARPASRTSRWRPQDGEARGADGTPHGEATGGGPGGGGREASGGEADGSGADPEE
ncbi:MAG TPA: copper resistance protein CopC [Microbacteriaceae bacterium]|nr:copper resistance protein CopC [Microbacteriaceae bacterium]